MYKFEIKDKKGVVDITISKEDWEKAVQTAYEKTKGKYKVQGFRNGKAPRRVIEQNYGDTVFFDEAFEESVSTEYGKFLTENKDVKPAEMPHVEDSSFTLEDGLKAKLVFDLVPEVKLASLSTLKTTKGEAKVDEKRLEQEIESLRNAHARFVESDKAAANGDFATINFSGSIDGVKFEGGTAENYRLELGSHSFIEGFEEQVVGMKVAETKDVKVSFPQTYHVEDLKGKPAVFAVKVNKIEKKELPEINDKFISDVTDFETIDEYKKDLTARLEKDAATKAERDFENALIDEFVAKSEVEVPSSMIEHEVHHMLHDFEHKLSHQGMKLEDYLAYSGSTVESFKKEREADAIKSVKTRLVLQELLTKNDIKASKEDIDSKINDYAKSYNMKMEDVKSGLSQDDLAYFENEVLMTKLIALIKNKK